MDFGSQRGLKLVLGALGGRPGRLGPVLGCLEAENLGGTPSDAGRVVAGRGYGGAGRATTLGVKPNMRADIG